MLGKTANGLFWMYRYLERAENTARMIDAGQRLGLTRLDDRDEEWASVLQSAGSLAGYREAHDTLTKDAAIDWMLRSKDNPSSVLSSIAAARHNARLVRTAITGEVWEAINAAYMSAKEVLARKVSERDLPATLRKLRHHTSLVRGMTHGTMLRNDAYDFARLGTFLERADNTARILDVKYYVLLPSARSVGSTLDNVQWENILRSVSALGGFRMEYGNASGPMEIAEFLVLDKRMPRSLAFCAAKLRDNLRYLNGGGLTLMPTLQKVDHLQRTYLSHDIHAVMDYGLHEFIQKILSILSDIAQQIEVDFRFYK
ncbi:alpha-E domain-containing protein [Pacificoceanicola onchidii]|uniref:alpha-E domain-containing protein n=1 Tax=Pacificoceanicola onchidii TaxID=2562685 RepID=UPI0010A5CADF|nr:alpha-E domain-containing protein [Pacificoceanicola onchidii]